MLGNTYKTIRISNIIRLVPIVIALWYTGHNGVEAIECLSCGNVSSPELCNTTIDCRANEVCYTELISNNVFRLGCVHITDCGDTKDLSIIGRRFIADSTYCGLCCRGEGCNRQLCGSNSQTDATAMTLVRPPIRTDPCVDETPTSCSLLTIQDPSYCDNLGIRNYVCRKTCGTCNNNMLHSKDCFYQSQKYQGAYSKTGSGKMCLSWSLFTTNDTSLVSRLPDSTISDAGNKCRDPGGKGHPWCYTDPNQGWEYCAVPYCQECHFPNATTSYQGYVDVTSDGTPCARWDANVGIPFDSSAFPDGNASLADNYCRNPFHFDDRLLCYTNNGFQSCSVPECSFECRDDPATDCNLIARYVCTNEYSSITLCPKTCGKCYFGLLPPRIVNPPSGTCEDMPDANCFPLSSLICSDPKGAHELCPRTCNVCCILVLFTRVQLGQCDCSGIDEPNTTRNPTGSSFLTGESVTYECVDGYGLTSGSLSRTCQVDTSWTATPPVCDINTCASPAAVAFTSRIPDQVTYNYATSITYTCNTGYSHTSGNLTRTCQADTNWSGNEPVCTINTCASPAAVAFTSRIPDQVTYNYATSITYTCDTGYSHTSGNLTRTCQADTNWSGNEPVCTINTCASPAAVAFTSRIPDQLTYNYATSITYTCNTGYSHTSGNLTRTCQAATNWSGDEPVCTINTCASPAAVAFTSRIPDQVTYNYATSITYTCNTGYSHTSGNLTRACQADTNWSGDEPVCTINTCASPAVAFTSRIPDQVTYNYATSITYTCNTGYSHTSGNLTRTCQADTNWSGDEPVCTINTCASPAAVAFTSRIPDQSTYNYATSITYTCNTGYSHTSGNLTRTCQADANWSGDEPVCTIYTCVSPAAIAFTSRIPDQVTYNYATSITYTCDIGYSHTSGNLTRTCQADTNWSGDEPVCTINTCASPAVAFTSRIPDQVTYNYATSITYTCDIGYSHTSGNLTRTCQADTNWSGNEPVCTINTCASPAAVAFTSRIPDQVTYNYATSITYTCNTGYSHTSGNLTRTCQADTNWSGDEPVCTINTCASPAAVALTSRIPDQVTYNYATSITYTCNTGYSHTSGNLTRTCQADTNWSGDEPVCTIKECASPATVPNSSKSPDQATYVYATLLTYMCDAGYTHTSGDLNRTCQATTNWSGTAPVCTINTCVPDNVPNSSRLPTTATIDYGSSITYTCDLVYDRTAGDLTRLCQANSTWDGTTPVCTLVACSPHPTMTFGTVTPVETRYLFGESVSITCDAGYYVSSGNDERTCLTSGTFNGTKPSCSRVTCPGPLAVPDSTFTPAGPYDYDTDITYTCDLSFNHTSGNLTRTCQQDFDWSGTAPVCSVSACIKEEATFMTISPDTVLHNFGDVMTYECILGYNQTSGDLLRSCQTDGSWDGALPACAIVKCPLPDVPDHTTIDPTDAQIEYNNTIEYTCDLGYNRTGGDQNRTCLETGLWSNTEADCTLVTCSPPPDTPFATYQPVQTVYNYSTTVTFQCDYGYYMSSGSLDTQCTELGTWTTTRVCTIVECTASSEPHSSFLPSQSIFDFNTTVTYTCDTGHNLTAGNDVRTCTNDTTWDGLPPVCDPVICAFPEVVDYSTSTPTQLSYVYEDWIHYACVLGYELTSGNSSRECDEHAEWTGTLPNCTIKVCVPPDAVQNASYTPVLPEHNWNTSVTFTCDTGYEYNTGDEVRTCLDNKSWSGTTSTCKIKKCPRIDVQYMTLSPADDGGEYVYLTEITYACVVGYNHSYGDLQRTCQDSKDWSGTLPNCTIVTCDPPDYISNTNYAPVEDEYIWQAEIHYACDPLYHYVSGINVTTCNESGIFPPVDFDCSVMHTLTKNAAEPQYAWINETATSEAILFDFDGMCDVTLSATPSSLGMSHAISGSVLTVNVTEIVSSVYGTYVVTLSPYRMGRTFGDVTTDVYYGREITGLEGWINNPISTIMVDGEYEYEVNATDGTTVQLDWDFGDGGTYSQYFGTGVFSSATQTHTYTAQGEFNITVTATNAISSQTIIIPIIAVYGPNNIELLTTTNTPNTTQTIDIQLEIKSWADLPMRDVNITVHFGDDTANVTEPQYVGSTLTLPHYFTYSHLYPVQGDYHVEARIENYVGYLEFSQTIQVWDPLENLDLVYVGGNGIYITNATMELEFVLHPEAGFLYTIDYGDGSVVSVTDTEVYKHPYNVSSFTHAYASPKVYTLRWTAQNGLYYRDVTKVVIVQNPVASHSYTQEPIGKKYPWSVLQVTDIRLNVTLNDTVAVPTNVTCDFDAGDGSAVVYGLEFDGQFIDHLHRYLLEGVFDSVLNCSNLVSNYDYVFNNITVLKYQANFTTVVFEPLVPLNISDSVTVYFQIENDGFAWLPYYVTLTFDFGNGVETFTYDTDTYTRVYSERGDYDVIVTSASTVTGTSDTDTYPLRLGVMYFDYNSSVAFINDTVVTYSMRGVLGTTTYMVDYMDGSGQKTCDSTDITGCEIHHLCPRYGNNTNVVTASNGTFVEIDEAYVVCDNPITVTIDHPEFKAIPDGVIDLKLRINETDLYIPNLFCTINMGDPLDDDTYTLNETVTFADPFNFTYQYIALGRHGINMHCWNLINETWISSMITLTNKDFLFLGSFDRQYSQPENALPLTLMRDVELFSRLVVIANLTDKYAVNEWQVPMPVGDGNDRYSLLFPIGTAEAGKYRIILRTYFREEVDNAIFEPTFVVFLTPSPQVHFVGGRTRRMPRDLATLDAQTLSYDPANTGTPLTFGNWTCNGYDATSYIDAETQSDSNTGGTPCTLTSVSGSGVMSLDLTVSPVKTHYVVKVTGSNNNNSESTNHQIIHVVDNAIPLNIRCVINCLSKVAVTSYLQVTADVDHNCPSSFSWTLQEKGGATVSLTDKTETGTFNRTLTINPNTFLPGKWYVISLLMTYDGGFHGPAYHEFLTNQPPQGGNCTVYRFEAGSTTHDAVLAQSGTYETTLGRDEFNITCSYWMDEEFTENTFMLYQPLFYYFYLQYGPNPADRQMLYFDPGSTSNLVSVRIGDPDDGYKATLVLRIADIIGDYTEITYNMIVNPPAGITTEDFLPLQDSAHLVILTAFTSQFEEEIIKANRTWDYRTLSRKIQDVTSVYNQLALNSTATIVLNPDDLLTLGNQRNEEGEILSWNEYWNLIVDVKESEASNHLIEFNEGLTASLYHTVSTWPANKRMPLISIEVISKGLSATLKKTEYANITAAIHAAYCSDKMAEDLVLHTLDRDYPPTEPLMCALSGVFELNMFILQLLQTVLTPNLPEDPTMDEMRTYLEYIKIFEGTSYNNQSFLSLQEQTFLAQKQLQKYHLQKYLKSEASKTALPNINLSYQNIGNVLKSMSALGRQELIQDNDYMYLSAEKARTYELRYRDIVRPRIVMEVKALSEVTPGQCNASEVTITTSIFKFNPYFWGKFADRITSYVSTITLDGATLDQSNIIYRIQNYITPPCRDATPTYDENDKNKMIYIALNRRYQDDDILLFIRPDASELTYEVYFNEEEKPDLEEDKYSFRTDIHTNMWTQEDGYKLLVTSQQFSATGQIWIALRPLLGDSEDESLLKRPFCARIVSVNCVVWKEVDGEYNWDRYTCEVSELSSRSETVCNCNNYADSSQITIGTTFYVPESKVDFQDIDDTYVPYGMQPVYGVIYATIAAYFLLVLWLWREDMRDPYKWSYSLLIDNDIADQYFYTIRVYTGMRSGSGTKSKIAFILAGDNTDTGIRILDDPSHIGFERGSVRTFIMGTRRDLGELISLRIWHDDTGVSEAAWYLNQITVTDLNNFQMCGFHCDTWFDYDKGDQRVDRVFTATPIQEAWSFKEMASYMMAEHHAWISTFIRPFRSSFTRIQRVSCLIGMMYLNMFLATLFLKSKTKEEITVELNIGPFRFSSENLTVAMMVVGISTALMTIVSFLFRYARSKTSLLSQDDSFFVRHYKRLNDRFKFDRSVLNLQYPPAENAVVYDYNFLPQSVVYVSWTLIAIFVALGLFVMLTTAKSWPEAKSEEWMTTIIVCGLVSFLFIEIIKVILIIIPYVLLCKRAYEPPRPYMDVETLKEIAKYNSSSLTMSPDSTELDPAISPDEDTLIDNKRIRMNNHQLLKMFTQLALYSGILFIVYTISYAKRDTMSYSLKKNIEDRFNMTLVKDVNTYVDWLNDRFVDQYFSHSFYGKTYTETDIKPFAEDLVNYRVGPARLRQLRIEPEPCMGPLGEGVTCYNKYKDTNLDTQDYCLGWKDPDCDVSEKSDYFSSPAWEYLSAAEVWGFFTMATYATYGGGGYFMKLDVNKDVCLRIFDELVAFQWFDRQTRATILEFTLYNANKNLFVYSKFVAEFPEVGGVITYTDVQVFRLYNDTGEDGDTIILLEFLFTILVLGATLKIIYEIATDGCKYFKSVWNMLDVSALLMSYTTIIVYIYKLSILELTIATFHADKNAYVGFENLAFYDYFVNTTHALLVFILSVRVSKILGYSGKINEMAAVVSSSAEDLGGFFVIFAIAYFAYVILGTELFRTHTEKYKDMFQTYGTLTEAIVGKNKLENILTSNPGYAEFYYFTFVIFVLMTLATLAAAILNFGISHVKEEQKGMTPTNIVEILADRISWLVNAISRRFSKNPNGNDHKQFSDNEEEADAREILEDIGQFIRYQIRLSHGNREDMYRVYSPTDEPAYRHPRSMRPSEDSGLSYKMSM